MSAPLMRTHAMRMPQSQVMRAWRRHTERQREGILQALSLRFGRSRRQVLVVWRRLAFHSRCALLQVVFLFPVFFLAVFFGLAPLPSLSWSPPCPSSIPSVLPPWSSCVLLAVLCSLPVSTCCPLLSSGFYLLSSAVLCSLVIALCDTHGGRTGKNVAEGAHHVEA